MSNLRSLLIEVSQTLRPLLLINRELWLCLVLLSCVHVSLSQPVVSIGNIGIIFKRLHILWNGVRIMSLVR